MDIHGRPLLEIWVELLERHHVNGVLINTHHHAEQVEQCVDRIRDRYSIQIEISYEKELLGSAGTLFANQSYVAGDRDFIIAYADNLTDVNLGSMVRHHRGFNYTSTVLTMGLYRTPNPSACGIATLNEENQIIEFTEKPEFPKGDLANAGIYVANSKLFDYFPEVESVPESYFDIGYHLLPKLMGKMIGYSIDAYLRDIGTIESYHTALDEWAEKA